MPQPVEGDDRQQRVGQLPGEFLRAAGADLARIQCRQSVPVPRVWLRHHDLLRLKLHRHPQRHHGHLRGQLSPLVDGPPLPAARPARTFSADAPAAAAQPNSQRSHLLAHDDDGCSETFCLP